MRLRTLGLIGGILAGLFLTVQALEVPPLRQRVTDLTGTLTAREIEELELTPVSYTHLTLPTIYSV